MFKLIIDILQHDNYYGINKRIDIAKGMYSIPTNIKDSLNQLKRISKSKFR